MPILSERVQDLQGSAVRAMLAAAQRPEVISFAGGLPAPDSFADIALPSLSPDLLQYGPTEGEPALRAKLAEELSGLGFDVPAERVLILSGSQQGVDLAAKLLIDRSAGVAVESPTYLAALQVFRFFGAAFSVLDRADPAARWRAGERPSTAYVTPTFQNPTGACWSMAERQALAQACDAHDVVLFEDDPYRDLAYDACERRPICTMVRRGSWIYQGSFSKTVAPGLRLGFLTASEDLFPYLVRLKQAADLHANRLSQAIVLNYLNDPGRPARVRALVDRYRHRRDRFEDAMRRHLAVHADWAPPPGGLFFWATLKNGRSAEALLARAAPRNVLFTPGVHFTAEPGRCASSLRLNFSHADEAAAERGLVILGELLGEEAARIPAAADRPRLEPLPADGR